jgi:two-component system, OmpR family, KDP operon response regulator KdpE
VFRFVMAVRSDQGKEGVTARILIVDDEPAIRRLVRGAAERAGHSVAEAATAAEAMIAARREGCELVLLDLGLPDRDGLELVPLIKAIDRAVIVLTARDETGEKVAALDLGADDYIVKPFDTDELLARIRVALRHRSGGDANGGIVAIGEVMIDLGSRLIQRNGVEVAVTRKEYAVLAELARHPGRVVTHTALLRAVWGDAHVDDVEYLRVAVRGLRSKLEPDPASPSLIRNEPGVGYRLLKPD